MSSDREGIIQVAGIIAEEAIKGSKATVDEISQRVKIRINELKEIPVWWHQIPIEHLKNLIRRKLKENELMLRLGDPQGRDDKIREELRQIDKDIQKTKPNFLIIKKLFSHN